MCHTCTSTSPLLPAGVDALPCNYSLVAMLTQTPIHPLKIPGLLPLPLEPLKLLWLPHATPPHTPRWPIIHRGPVPAPPLPQFLRHFRMRFRTPPPPPPAPPRKPPAPRGPRARRSASDSSCADDQPAGLRQLCCIGR